MDAGRLARRAGAVLLVVVLVAAGAWGISLVVRERDDATITERVPGRTFADLGADHLQPGEEPPAAYNSNPPTSGSHVPEPIRRDARVFSDDQLLHALELGNVVLAYGSAAPPPALRALARELAGPYDPALAEAGQAVILARRPGLDGVVALAWRHQLRARDPADPRLAQFVDHWLGRSGARPGAAR